MKSISFNRSALNHRPIPLDMNPFIQRPMTAEQLKKRTKSYGVEIARFCSTIYQYPLLKPYANQLIRASSSVGANYRAACRAKSNADFIYKMKIVEEECDECLFFLELIIELRPESLSIATPIMKEGNELLSIVVASIKTARNCKSNRYNHKSPNRQS